jgi:hypothetical protein
MISTHAVILHRDSELDAPVTLQYVEETLRGSQRRFEGRTVLRPQIDLRTYRWASVVDWIDVEFVLGRPSQHWKLNDRIERLTGRKEYPEALDVSPGGTATHYRLRVQEPNFRLVQKILADIEREYGFASPARVVGIEVCIDAYPKDPGEDARARLHGVLVRHFFPTTAVLTRGRTWPRFVPGLVKPADYIVSRNETDPRLDIIDRMTPSSDRSPTYTSTFYVGEEKDPRAMWRIQNKVLDKQNKAAGTREELAEGDKRVRIEVTLGPDGCRDASINDFDLIREFKFTEMQKGFFKFVLPTFGVYSPSGGGTSMMSRSAVKNRIEEARRQRFLNAGALALQIREEARLDHLRLNKDYFLSWHKARGSKMPKRSRVGAGPYGTHVAYKEMARVIERALASLQRKVRREMEG